MAIATALACLAWSGASAQVSDPGGPDAAAFGRSAGYPVGTRATVNQQGAMVGAYSHYHELFPSHPVARPAQTAPWRRAPREAAVTYEWRGETHNLNDYLARRPATGLLIARGDTILFEHYQYGRTEHDLFTSQSMAKTVVALLVGIAVADGAIRSIDDPAETYLPALAGSETGRTPIRAFLQMSSGLAFNEGYVGTSDGVRLSRLLADPTVTAAGAVAAFDTRVAAPGTMFHYAGRDTEVLALVLAAATRTDIADYLQARLWQPMGAEADAAWVQGQPGREWAYCCLSATLRDYARLGRLVAADGVAQGRQVVLRQWLLDMTSYRPDGILAPGRVSPGFGYGYQVWLPSGPRRQASFQGIHGQRIFADPASGLVLVQTAVVPAPTGDPGLGELTALWRAAVAQLGQ